MLLPAGSVDTHAHVFEPTLSMAEGRRYTPGYAATLDAYFACLDASGLTYGVLVQPSFLGTDNGYLVQALRESGGRCKGVAVVDGGFSASRLAALKAEGVEGIRLNLFGQPAPALQGSAWQGLLAEVNRLGWHVEVHCPWLQLPDVLTPLHDAGCRVVVDHLGRPDFGAGTDLRQLEYLCSQARDGRTWVKLSGAYRLWPAPDAHGYAAAVRMLLRHLGPERLMWGSDWPHTQHETVASLPAALQLLTGTLFDGDTLEHVLVRTPQTLFDF